MTRVCQFCQLEFGEKCGRCGSENVRLMLEGPWTDIEAYACINCGHTFLRGEDGKTHGICDGCHLKAMLAISSRQPGGAECTN